MKHTFLRRILPWLIVAGIAGFAVYKLKVKPAEVIVLNVTQNTNADEVMGTGTLEARVKTTVSAHSGAAGGGAGGSGRQGEGGATARTAR
jgi:hypothetical protein